MGKTARSFEMDDRRKKAAERLALGGEYDDQGELVKMTKTEIAKKADISPSTLWSWEQRPVFMQYVDQVKMNTGLARKSERVNMARKVSEKALESILEKLDNAETMKMQKLEFLLAEGRRWLDLLRHEVEGDGGNSVGTVNIQNNNFNLDDLGDRFKQRSKEAKDITNDDEDIEVKSAPKEKDNPFSSLINNGDEFIDESDKVMMDAEGED